MQLQHQNQDASILFSVVGWLSDLAACLTQPPDLHAITVPQDPQTLRNNIKGIACLLIACGIDTDRSIMFQQSKAGAMFCLQC